MKTAVRYNVLFLCTGNSARSILGEAILNNLCPSGRLRGHSAGSAPKGEIHPLALAVLEDEGIPTAGLRSKSWDEFTAPGAPQIDLVITVCDRAAAEPCPLYSGKALRVHWPLPDPRTLPEFLEVYAVLRRRIGLLSKLPMEEMDCDALRRRVEAIGGV
jgi:arsenate reductase (thioredoxin)